VTEAGTAGPLKVENVRNVELATLGLTQAEHDAFYAGYANGTLWPIFHYRLDLADFNRTYEDGYRRVNERFAARLRPLIGPDDVVWVHDYHFFHLAQELRALGVTNRIGFFLHIPFPGPDILTALPRHGRLVRSMLAYDLVGFQSERDRRHFATYVVEEAGGTELGDGRLTAHGLRTRAAAFPIGIDTAGFAGFAVSVAAQRQQDRILRMLGGRQQIIGVDRLDYSKGLPERFRAFERMLEDYPESLGRVSLMQIAPESRAALEAYSDIRRELEGLAGHINGRFADVDWTPIRFLTRAFPRRSLAGLCRASRIGLVTPLRDGMNLVAKEYVAAQDPADPGVLVLSRFAGAAEELREGLIVNPYATEEVAEALHTAVKMPLDERQARFEAMYARLARNDANAWANAFLNALEAPV
jgi:trehalose 6-phosphate synthase